MQGTTVLPGTRTFRALRPLVQASTLVPDMHFIDLIRLAEFLLASRKGRRYPARLQIPSMPVAVKADASVLKHMLHAWERHSHSDMTEQARHWREGDPFDICLAN